MALVQHMLTEEEASLVQHLGSPRGRTAAALAAVGHRPLAEIQPILDRLANEKHILLTYGRGDEKRYGFMLLAPGVFKSVLVRTSLESLTPWHRRFAELFEALYETGYFVDYADYPVPWIRYVPVGQTIEHHSLALPLDKVEEILDPYNAFHFVADGAQLPAQYLVCLAEAVVRLDTCAKNIVAGEEGHLGYESDGPAALAPVDFISGWMFSNEAGGRTGVQRR